MHLEYNQTKKVVKDDPKVSLRLTTSVEPHLLHFIYGGTHRNTGDTANKLAMEDGLP